MSVFQRAGVAYLAGSKRSLKTIIDSQAFFVSVRDLYRALQNPSSHADIYCVTHKVRNEAKKTKKIELSFSVVFTDSEKGASDGSY